MAIPTNYLKKDNNLKLEIINNIEKNNKIKYKKLKFLKKRDYLSSFKKK